MSEEGKEIKVLKVEEIPLDLPSALPLYQSRAQVKAFKIEKVEEIIGTTLTEYLFSGEGYKIATIGLPSQQGLTVSEKVSIGVDVVGSYLVFNELGLVCILGEAMFKEMYFKL